MNDRLAPKKHRAKRKHPKKGQWRARIRIPKSDLREAVGLPTPDLSIPFYHKERFQKIAGLSGAMAGAVLYFIPGTQALGEIVGGLGLASWGTAAQLHRIKQRRAAGQNTWWDILISIIQKIMQSLGL